MAKRKGRKYWKAEAKRLERVTDELFTQLQARANDLKDVDLALRDAQFPGPTLTAWADQLATFFFELANKRGVTPLPFPGAMQPFTSSEGHLPVNSIPPGLVSSAEAQDNGIHELITVDDR